MFDLSDLHRPIVGAPMAGGPSTPRLAASVSSAGGLGFLAAGYLTPEQLEHDIAEVRHFTDAAFGVNVFVPQYCPPDQTALEDYRAALQTRYDEHGVQMPDLPDYTDDHYRRKIESVLRLAVPVVSFTFGCPDAEVIAELRDRGIAVVVTVTSVAEASTAAAANVDALCVQGPDAGGHRATFDIAHEPGSDTLESLVGRISSATPLPLIAAGGVRGPSDVTHLLGLGASAVQVGTLLLRTPEAGTKQAHKDALADSHFDRTVVTRSFSGRPARALENDFVRRFHTRAPALYPYVNSLTGPLRRACIDDAENLNLWAGSGFRHARDVPAMHVVAELAG